MRVAALHTSEGRLVLVGVKSEDDIMAVRATGDAGFGCVANGILVGIAIRLAGVVFGFGMPYGRQETMLHPGSL